MSTAQDQLTIPILQPTAPYETIGQTHPTVFMNTIMFHDGQWWMYYGAGDNVIALANAPLRSQDSVAQYNDFTSTSFEDGQRMPDWASVADTDPGGGGVNNVTSPGAMVMYQQEARGRGAQLLRHRYGRRAGLRLHEGVRLQFRASLGQRT
jgi:hypothetical protein